MQFGEKINKGWRETTSILGQHCFCPFLIIIINNKNNKRKKRKNEKERERERMKGKPDCKRERKRENTNSLPPTDRNPSLSRNSLIIVSNYPTFYLSNVQSISSLLSYHHLQSSLLLINHHYNYYTIILNDILPSDIISYFDKRRIDRIGLMGVSLKFKLHYLSFF